MSDLDDDVPGDAYRDGYVHVLADRCSTCVFRAGNLMSLSAGRLRDLVDSNLAANSALTCHATLYGQTPHNAICRGFFDAYGEQSTPLRMARVLDRIKVDPVPE